MTNGSSDRLSAANHGLVWSNTAGVNPAWLIAFTNESRCAGARVEDSVGASGGVIACAATIFAIAAGSG